MARVACLTVAFGLLGLLAFSSFDIRGPAAIYPRVLIASALVLLVMTAFIELRRPDGASGDAELQMLVSGPNSGRARFAVFAGAWLAYPLVLPMLGFVFATTLMLIISARVVGFRGLPRLTVGSLVFALTFAVALKTVIYVPVPSAWPDRLIDSMVYALRRA